MAFNNYLEDENDKPYFTTNSLAYYYDKMEGFAEKVEQAAKVLNVTKEEVEKNIAAYIEQNKNELDQRLAQWDGKLETFDSSVETLLTEWVGNGTLTPLIDSTLIDQKITPLALQLDETGENLNARLDAKIIDSGAANAEVTDARISTVKSKAFSTVRNRFEENEADVKRITAENADQFPATNLIKNGDFKNGLSDWLTSGAALSVVGNTLQLIGSGALTEYAANQRIDYVTGHKYFVKFTAKTLNPIATRIRGRFAGGYANVDILNPVNGTSYTKSTVFTATVGGLYTDGIQFLYPSTTDATGATGVISHVMSVDLTAAFGIGKEPTVEKFETLLSKFENNWFGGTRAIITVKDVYETSPTNTEVFTPFEKTQVAKISSLEKTVATIAPEVNLSGISEAYIIACQEDETPVVSGATLSMDTANFKVGSRGYKLTGTAAGTMQLNLTPSITPMKVPNIGVVGLWIYVPDKTKISSIWVNLYSSSDSAVTWEASSAYSESLEEQGGLRNGWNYIRWHASQSTNTTIHNLTNWGTIYKARVMVVTSGATNITIGKLVGETNKKAKMIFVEDSQFRTFYNVAYPQLKERNMPVTWALRISTIGEQVGTVGEQITEEEIEKLSIKN